MSEPLGLSHQSLLDPLFRALNVQLAEYTFANLYLFRKIHEYVVVEMEGAVFIKAKAYDGASYLMPTAKHMSLSQLDKAKADCFFPIPEEWLSSLEQQAISFSFFDMDSDYLFERESFVTYEGKSLSKKRNLVRQFFDTYGPAHVEVLRESSKENARVVVEKWNSQMEHEADAEACYEAILLCEQLHLQGHVYYSEKKPVGLIIGESLGKDVFVIHFAKADKEYKGIYQYMYQDLAKKISHKWINMEQDLGSLELKQSKKSYYPSKLIKKYRVSSCRKI